MVVPVILDEGERDPRCARDRGAQRPGASWFGVALATGLPATALAGLDLHQLDFIERSHLTHYRFPLSRTFPSATVKALPPYGSDHPLANRIRLRRPRWRFQHAQAQRLDRFIQMLREDAIPIMNQVTVSIVETNNFSQLL